MIFKSERAMRSSKKPTTGWQSDNVSVSTSSFWFSKKKHYCSPWPLPPSSHKKERNMPAAALSHRPPLSRRDAWRFNCVMKNLTKKRRLFVHRTPNWRVSDSPRKNEDRKPLKFEKPTHTSLFTKRKLKIRLFPPPFFLFPEWSGIVFITLPSFIYI